MRCIAVLAVRNGLPYLPRFLSELNAQNIEVAVIDHDSSDGSYDVCLNDLGHGVCLLERMPFTGVFSLREQLRYKQAVIDKLSADWIIHQDVDELLQSPTPGESLSEAIHRADTAGANCINFDEFIFLPYPDDIADADFFSSHYYYFFQPRYPRLMRAWKKNAGFNNFDTGGHLLQGDVVLFPEDFVLRHYLFTSQQQAFEKYSQRRFSEDEVSGGWHGNRLNIPPTMLIFPAKENLKKLASLNYPIFDKSEPWSKHYWEH